MSPQLDVFEELRQAAVRRLKPDHAPTVLGKTMAPDILERVIARAERLAIAGIRFTFTPNREGHPCVWAAIADGDRQAMDAHPSNWGAAATIMLREGTIREYRRVRTKDRRKVTLWEWTGK